MRRLIAVLLCSTSMVLGAPVHAQDGEISMLCKRHVIHNPLADVQARPTDPNTIVTTTVQIPLTVDLAKWLDMPAGTGGEGVLGLIELSDTGTVTYNGQDISGQVDAKCGNASSKSSVNINNEPVAQPQVPAMPAPQPAPAPENPAVTPE
jgi:hypothetical protein